MKLLSKLKSTNVIYTVSAAFALTIYYFWFEQKQNNLCQTMIYLTEIVENIAAKELIHLNPI